MTSEQFDQTGQQVEQAQQPPERRGIRQRFPWLLPGLILLVGVALIAGVVLARPTTPTAGSGQQNQAQQGQEQQGQEQQGQGQQEQGQQPADLSYLETRDPDDLLALGPVDAPVGLVIFSDYQCPFCARWSHDTLPEMIEAAEAGDLRIEWRDVNIFGEGSENAARATLAAAMQDKMWEFHDTLFADGSTRSGPELERDGLIAIAGDLGLDTDQFAADFDSQSVIDQIRHNADTGRSIGVASTPAFLLGGEPIIGAQPTEVFRAALAAALERAGQ